MAQKMILISCSDGRITGAAGRASAVAKTHGFDFGEQCVYRIKIPGPDGSCIGIRGGAHQEALREDIGVLVEKTGAALVAIAGHCDCAGYPVTDKRHTDDTLTAARAIHAWCPDVPVLALLDHKKDDGTWYYEEIAYFDPDNAV
jgi:carbonic anhydrase